MWCGRADADSPRPLVSLLGWQIDVDAFVQVQDTVLDQTSQDQISPTTGLPLNTESFEVRRGLLRVIGHKDDFRAQLEISADTVGGSPETRLFTAFVAWTPHAVPVEAAAGLMLIPFGTAVPTNARFREFMEQPTFLQAFFPGDTDEGVLARGSFGFLRYAIAAMNAATTGDVEWKGRDPIANYDLLGRIGADVDLPHMWGRPHLTTGVSALDGEGLHPGVPPSGDQLVYVDVNGTGIVDPSEIQIIPGSPGTPSQSFHHNAVGADADVSWCLQWAGRGHAFFEGAIATNLDRGVYYADPIATQGRDLREIGFMAGFTQHLSRYAFVGVRYDYYDGDRDANQRVGLVVVNAHPVFQTWAFLAALQKGTVRVSAEYDRVRDPFGIADNGTVTTRDADRVVVRAQVEM
jgi:hypothetical protein